MEKEKDVSALLGARLKARVQNTFLSKVAAAISQSHTPSCFHSTSWPFLSWPPRGPSSRGSLINIYLAVVGCQRDTFKPLLGEWVLKHGSPAALAVVTLTIRLKCERPSPSLPVSNTYDSMVFAWQQFWNFWKHFEAYACTGTCVCSNSTART